MAEGVRIDKWLWAVRVFKTRSIATEECKSGRIKLGGVSIKPSHEVKVGEEYVIQMNPIRRTIKVKELLTNRVAAKLVENYMLDLTPQAEYDKLKMAREVNFEYRERGVGRPTKRERREIDVLKKYLGLD